MADTGQDCGHPNHGGSDHDCRFFLPAGQDAGEWRCARCGNNQDDHRPGGPHDGCVWTPVWQDTGHRQTAAETLRDALRIHHPIMRSETGPFSGCRCGAVGLGQDVIAHVVGHLYDALAGRNDEKEGREETARAWDEGFEAAAEWMASNGRIGIPHDPPLNPYDRNDEKANP